jgi:hypothetical protein
MIHSVLLNRSTLYSEKAGKAFGAMFDEIKKRTEQLKLTQPSRFVGAPVNFHVIPGNPILLRLSALTCEGRSTAYIPGSTMFMTLTHK